MACPIYFAYALGVNDLNEKYCDVRSGKKTVRTDIQMNSLWSRLFFMLRQQHYTLKKVEKGHSLLNSEWCTTLVVTTFYQQYYDMIYIYHQHITHFFSLFAIKYTDSLFTISQTLH